MKISFKATTSLENKKNIDLINFITKDQKMTFSSFNLFILNNYNSFQITMNIISYVLMIYKVSSIKTQ